MKWIWMFLLAVVGNLLTGCGSADSFTVDGQIAEGGTSTVELTYYADGAVKRSSASAHDGKFRLEGSASSPALGFITIAGGNPVAAVVVSNGDDI